MRILAILLSALCLTGLSGAKNATGSGVWHYGREAVKEWKSMYSACGENAQSPIDVVKEDVKYSPQLDAIELFNYAIKPTGLTLKNNGHTAQIDVTGDQYVHSGGLGTTYKLLQFHFHWGSGNNNGSEHRIDGRAYPMEMHLVHYAVREGNVTNALQADEGLAVLGFFFEISESNNTKLSPIIKGLEHVKYKGQSVSIEEFDILSILPADLRHYYRYPGSLTTPPCYESVVWTLFRSTIQISQSQLGQFRALHSQIPGAPASHGEIVDNFRPVQPINKRDVQTNSPDLVQDPLVTKVGTTPTAGTPSIASPGKFVLLAAILSYFRWL